jgi:hypothetical protein
MEKDDKAEAPLGFISKIDWDLVIRAMAGH